MNATTKAPLLVLKSCTQSLPNKHTDCTASTVTAKIASALAHIFKASQHTYRLLTAALPSSLCFLLTLLHII